MDNFNRTDTTILENGWIEDKGDWSIVSNQLLAPNQDEAIMHSTNYPDKADYFVQVDAKSIGGTNDLIEVMARFYDSNNFYLFQVGNEKSMLYKKINGNWTVLFSDTYSRSDETFNTYRIEVRGNKIFGYVDGVLVAHATDTSLVIAGTGGLRRGTHIQLSKIIYDNYEMGELSTSSIVPAQIYSEVKYVDNFNRTDSSQLGSDWIEDVGDWQTFSNQLSLSLPLLSEYMVHNLYAPTAANYFVQVDAKIDNLSQGHVGIFIRFLDTDNFYLFQYGKNKIQIYRKLNGSWLELTSEVYSTMDNEFHTYRINVIGSKIIGYLDGAQLIAVNDFSLKNTGYGGLRKGDFESEVIYDNFKIGNQHDVEIGSFNLPFQYSGRKSVDENTFIDTFWQRMRALFDHEFEEGSFVNFLGETAEGSSDWWDCSNVDRECYDSHNGTDFTASKGEDVLSATDGVVVYASETGELEDTCTPLSGDGFGCVVVVKHSDTLYSMYAHLKHVDVVDSDHVTEETILGQMGNTGCKGKGCIQHLHFAAMQPKLESIASANFLSRKGWETLLMAAGESENNGNKGKDKEVKKPYKKFKPFCNYNAEGATFTFQDPSGWYGGGTDPWDNYCGVASPVLWKYPVDSVFEN